MSIRDRFRYQACDQSGTFKNETEHIFAKLIYDYEEYESRHLNRVGANDNYLHHLVWTEQFDHVSKDFLSSLGHNGYEYMMDELHLFSMD